MIPVNEPLILDKELENIIKCVKTGWISSEGPFVGEFEEKFSRYIGVTHGIAVCNGTAALEAALYAAGVGEGDEVILPSFTIISCVIAIIRVGAVPVLVDIEKDTWNMIVDQVEAKITSRTKAVMPVHIYGHPVDMDPLVSICEKHGLTIIEDASEVHGAEYKGVKCGAIGQVGVFSFYANKLITTGEGGMVVTSDPNIAERARSYRNLCFDLKERFSHEELGYNFRMTSLQAAIGVAQLERIDSIVNFKREMGEYYREKLEKIRGLQIQTEKEWAKSVYWMYAIQLDETLGITAKVLMDDLKNQGIGTRPFFKGMHQQPVLLRRGLFRGESYPNTERAYKYGCYLPSGMTLTKEQVDTVCTTLASSINRLSGSSGNL